MCWFYLDHISEDDEENELNRTYSLETENELKLQLDKIKTSTTNNLHEEFVKVRSNTHDIIKTKNNGIFSITITIIKYVFDVVFLFVLKFDWKEVLV